ncbi:GTP 3',8-cyclase MoaA [Thermodesulfovibrionales bacterium]|nr:GTP 3',8-cyclase MoaA [Thermodesulfovibrionales bacterium]
MGMIKGSSERIIDYLRISVTDRCNLRCIYCMPSDGIRPVKHKDIIRYEEIIRIVRIATYLGIKKIRLTGGEPLVRKNLEYLIVSISNIPKIQEISLTTNGVLLKEYAHLLASAGLRRVNVSLDSIRPGRYKEITRGGDLRSVMEGIHEAERAGLLPVKINMIPIKGINDDEIEEFARLAIETHIHVRFIEFMPIGAREIWSQERSVPTDEIKERVSAIMPLLPVKVRGLGSARYFRSEIARGAIGFISPVTDHFCNSCNRIRLTSDGKIRPCLFSETEIDIKSEMRSGASDKEIERLLRLSVAIKPKRDSLKPQILMEHERDFAFLRPMSKIGG